MRKENPKGYLTGEDYDGAGSVLADIGPFHETETGASYEVPVEIYISKERNDVQLSFRGGTITLKEDGTYFLWGPVG